MQDRVYSLETEYAIAFQPQDQKSSPDKKEIVEVLRRLLVKQFGIANSLFLANGSKFHHDVGHAEWSLPECRSAYEAAVYDKAADWSLSSIVAEAEQTIARQGYQGTLLVVKNNVDPYGNTYGCHENYLAENQTTWLDKIAHLRLTTRYLIPFLVSRQILCGTGRVGYGRQLEPKIGFQIMQRADFIEEIVSETTTKERAIVSIGRENESFAEGHYRRLHLILADACLSGFATYLKLGITGIVLRMLEELGFDEIPHLLDPLGSLQTISRDPTCQVRVPLQDGRELSAIELQRLYLTQAQQFLVNTASGEEQQILQHWESTLTQLETNPIQLFGKIDWVTKKQLMDRYLHHQGKQWQEIAHTEPAYHELLRMDIQYHNLVTSKGLFYRLCKDQLDCFIPADEIERARHIPPAYTRAWIRGMVIATARQSGLKVIVDQWDQLIVNSRKVVLGYPLQFFSPDLYAIANPRNQHCLTVHCDNPAIAQQLIESLNQLGYTDVQHSDKPNEELNVKWGSASEEIIREIATAIYQTFHLKPDQIHLNRIFSADDPEIYINLGGSLFAPQPAPFDPVAPLPLNRAPYALTLMATSLELGEGFANDLERLGYQIHAVLPATQPEFGIVWGNASQDIIQEIVQAMVQRFEIADAQIQQNQDYGETDTRILIKIGGVQPPEEGKRSRPRLLQRWFGKGLS